MSPIAEEEKEVGELKSSLSVHGAESTRTLSSEDGRGEEAGFLFLPFFPTGADVGAATLDVMVSSSLLSSFVIRPSTKMTGVVCPFLLFFLPFFFLGGIMDAEKSRLELYCSSIEKNGNPSAVTVLG